MLHYQRANPVPPPSVCRSLLLKRVAVFSYLFIKRRRQTGVVFAATQNSLQGNVELSENSEALRATICQFLSYQLAVPDSLKKRNTSKKRKLAFASVSIKVTNQPGHTRSQTDSANSFVQFLVGWSVLRIRTVSAGIFTWLGAVWRTVTFPLRYYFLETASFVLLLCLSFGLLYQLQYIFFTNMPAVSLLTTQQPHFSSQITDRHGEVLYQVFGDENRIPTKLTAVSPYLINATVAIEDQDFWNHQGFSVRGFVRAIQSNAVGETVQGGSTITQQLVKMRLLSSERTLERKLKELVLALQVEQAYSKTEILEMYLNQTAYGGTAYGVAEASEYYFGKPAADLRLGEAALLAGLPAAPSEYSPFGQHPEKSIARQQEVLRRMVEDGYITQDQATLASAQPLVFRQQRHDIKAPYFVMYVLDRLEQAYGSDKLKEGGLIVTTTLDYPLQQSNEQLIATEMRQLERLHITNAAALVTNPQTGEVLSMIGGTNYFDSQGSGQVNVVLRPRQPGSAIKPITYATAFEKGLTPSNMILDAPISYANPYGAPYAPKNYDGAFHGMVTLRTALASSYNVPAVKLLSYIGVPDLIAKAQSMGITTWTEPSRYGLSLTLGGGDVTMLDMATAYGVFANMGKKVVLNPIKEIKTFQGEVLYQNPCTVDFCPSVQVLDPKVAFEVTHVLKDNQARTPAFGPLSALYIPPHEVAVKTGTTNNMRDNWTFGYTDNRLVATWVGNNDNSPMSYVASGITGASPIWHDIMASLLDDTQPHIFTPPAGIQLATVCQKGSTVTCGSCGTRAFEEVVVSDSESLSGCIVGAQAIVPDSPAQLLGSSSGKLTLKKSQKEQVL